MAKLELKIDAREVWSAYADRLYSGDKVVKSVTELLQNSVDAAAERVDASLIQEGKEWVLSFQDDGCGMTSEVFLERFLCLGAKGGEAGGRTGGNGVAKAVILFNRYVKDFSIDSVSKDGRRFRVTQAEILAGAELKERDASHGKPGVVFVIRYSDDTPVYMDYLREMLSYARPEKTSIFLNGQQIRCALEPSALHSEIAGFPVYKPKEPKAYKGHLIALSNGLPQFQEWVSGDETYVVDFTKTTYKDFTPARERLVNPTLEQSFRRLRERASYEKENPISSKIPPQKVQKRLAYNLKKYKVKKQESEAQKAPKDITLYESFAPILEDERRAALVTSGIRSVVESQEDKANRLLENLIPLRGVIFEDRSSDVRREWHPEKQKRVRKLLVLMDRSIEIFEEEYPDLEVANVGLMRNSQNSHDAHWSDEDKAVFIDIEKLDKKFQVAALQVLYTLTHELSHRWERSHNERFTSRQAQLLNVVALRGRDFAAVRKEVRRIR